MFASFLNTHYVFYNVSFCFMFFVAKFKSWIFLRIALIKNVSLVHQNALSLHRWGKNKSVTVSSNICSNALWSGQKHGRIHEPYNHSRDQLFYVFSSVCGIRFSNCLHLIIITKRCSLYVLIGDVFKTHNLQCPHPWMVGLFLIGRWTVLKCLNSQFGFKMQMNETRCMLVTHVEKPTLQCRTHWHVIVFCVYLSAPSLFVFLSTQVEYIGMLLGRWHISHRFFCVFLHPHNVVYYKRTTRLFFTIFWISLIIFRCMQNMPYIILHLGQYPGSNWCRGWSLAR